MKIKTDFITNSSSSNFLVVFEKPVQIYEDVKQFILYIEHAHIVFNDCMKQTPRKIDPNNEELREFVTNEIRDAYVPGQKWYMDDYRAKLIQNLFYEKYPKQEQRTREVWNEYHRQLDPIRLEYDKLNDENAKKMADEFISKYMGGYLYLFKYSDEDGEISSDMEHGDIFRKLPHLVLSHH